MIDHIENATVAELAANSLAAVRIFEKHGIDYCCGGKRPLEDVCRQKGQDVRLLAQELEAALQGNAIDERDWRAAPLHQLIDHIVTVHHASLRRELPAIQGRLDKVYRIYNHRYGPTLVGLPEAFTALRAELEPHMRKEEAVLFPFVRAVEAARTAREPVPRIPFGTIGNPIRLMETEHDRAGQMLRKIREITKDFDLPAHACVTYKALMNGLIELEQDLHLHIHLENNVLFPRAAELEARSEEGPI
jgi:regulator of cell morphogenesis and NO signaling